MINASLRFQRSRSSSGDQKRKGPIPPSGPNKIPEDRLEKIGNRQKPGSTQM